jgi:hypothetical protein
MSILEFFLSLCILLTAGGAEYSIQDGHLHAGFAPRKVPKKLEMMSLGKAPNGPTLIVKPVSSSARKPVNRIEAVENGVKEEELVPSKKILEISDYFTAFFDTQTPAHFPLYIKKSLPFYKFFSSTLSHGWHLACEVFRV